MIIAMAGLPGVGKSTLATALAARLGAVVILDDCTYTRAYQVTTLRRTAADLGQALYVIECDCTPEIAVTRLKDDLATGHHPAANRTPELYWEFRAAKTITDPKFVIDTARPIDASVEECLLHLTAQVSTCAALA